jgi:integrase
MKTRTRPLPPYLKRWHDKRTRKTYVAFRKRGHPLVPLPQPIGSDAFWIAYNSALKGKLDIGAELRSTAGSVSAALAAYYASRQWIIGLSDGTRAARRAILERFRVAYGQWPLRQITANFIDAYLDALTPHAARNTLKALRGFLKFAKHDVTREISAPKVKNNRHESWPPEVIAQYEAHHPVGTKARLAFALARFTGAARSEIVRMGPQHVVDGVDGEKMIVITRQKTGIPANIPVHPELHANIEATPLTGLTTFLINRFNKPFNANGLSTEFREWCNGAGLPQKYRLHGLRHTMGKVIAENGGNPHEIGAVLGHSDIRSALHYSQDADRKALARMGMSRLIGPKQDHPGNKGVSVDSPPQTLRVEKP